MSSGGEGWTPNPGFPVALCSQECYSIIIICFFFLREPILYALSAAVGLKDLTVFIMMMNKSKVFEEKSSF